MSSTVDVAGALAAIEKRISDNWTTTPVAYENKRPEGEWPPVDPVTKAAMPWVYCELIDVPAGIVGFGTPSNQTVADGGIIKMHVMVKKGSGLKAARENAVALGELFRQQKFFDTDPTAYVRTYTPTVGRSDLVSDDGNWVGMACSVPYDFFHRA